MSKTAKVYIVGYFISCLAIAGWLNANWQAEFRRPDIRGQREELGFAIVEGAVAASLWPIMLPSMYCIVGFGQDGWSLKLGAKSP